MCKYADKNVRPRQGEREVSCIPNHHVQLYHILQYLMIIGQIVNAVVSISSTKGRAADLTYIESSARMIASIAESNKIVVEKSTVPVKAAESILEILTCNRKKHVRYQVSVFCHCSFMWTMSN